MKKLVFTFILLFLATPLLIRAQDKDNSSFPWSFSFSYSPKINVSKYTGQIYQGEQTYFTSFDHKFDHRFSKHFSFSFGVDFNRFSKTQDFQSYDGTNYESQSSYQKLVQIELPIQLNYHFRDTSKMFDPYIKIAYRNAFYYQYFESLSSYSYEKNDMIRYFSFIEAGIGSYLKLSKKFSLIYESSLGYGLNYQRSHYLYIEGLIGVRYTIN